MDEYQDPAHDQMSAIWDAAHEVDATHKAFGDTGTTLAAFDSHAPRLAAAGVSPDDLAATRSALATQPEQTLAALKSVLTGTPPAPPASAGHTPRDQLAADEILKWEKSYPNAYIHGDGVPTIGVGHTRGVHMGDKAKPDQIKAWLEDDIGDAKAAVARALKPEVLQSLNDGQYAALVSLAYNMGSLGPTLVRNLNAGNMDAARDALALYNRQHDGKGGTKISQGLINRRADEMQLWNTGKVTPR